MSDTPEEISEHVDEPDEVPDTEEVEAVPGGEVPSVAPEGDEA